MPNEFEAPDLLGDQDDEGYEDVLNQPEGGEENADDFEDEELDDVEAERRAQAEREAAEKERKEFNPEKYVPVEKFNEVTQQLERAKPLLNLIEQDPDVLTDIRQRNLRRAEPAQPAAPVQPTLSAAEQEAARKRLEEEFYKDPVGFMDKLTTIKAQQIAGQIAAPLLGSAVDGTIDRFKTQMSRTDDEYGAVEQTFDKLLAQIPAQQLAGISREQLPGLLGLVYMAAKGQAHTDARTRVKASGKFRTNGRPAPAYGGGGAAPMRRERPRPNVDKTLLDSFGDILSPEEIAELSQ